MFDLVLNSDDDNYDLLLADNSQYPNYQWVYRLHRKQAESSYGNRNLTIRQQGELILRLASEKGCDVRLVEDGDQIAVILVTQLMKRISQIAECADMCFVDSSGRVDKDGTRFFVFLGKYHFGGVPLGVILTTSENESLLTTAFNTFKLMIPADAFGGRSDIRGPQIFMSDDSSAERNALKKSWPESILLLCTFHVLQCLVKKMLHANSKTDLGNAFSSLQKDSLAIKYPSFIAHIVSIYDRKCEWTLCYRELFVRGNNTNNICESAMKDHVLQRVKAFNMVHLADFVVSRFDLYFEKKILNVAFNRLTNKLMTKQAHLQRNVEFAKNGITKIADDIYSVPSEKDHNKRYVVNMDLACCECFIGRDGKLCKHQIAVVKYIGITSRNILPLKDPKQKQYLYHIATGKHMDLTFFQSLRDDQISDNEENVLTEQVRDATRDECIMQDNSNLAQNVDNVEILAQNYEMEHNSIDEVTHLNSTKQDLREVFDDLLEKLESKPELYLSSVDKFVTTYKSFKTDTNINSALHNFGKTLNECNTSASVYASKRRGKKIRVQPTAISRRHHIALGKGSTSAANTGRPRKPKVLNEHTYTAYRELKKAPHNLTKCVASDRSIGKTH